MKVAVGLSGGIDSGTTALMLTNGDGSKVGNTKGDRSKLVPSFARYHFRPVPICFSNML